MPVVYFLVPTGPQIPTKSGNIAQSTQQTAFKFGAKTTANRNALTSPEP